MKRTLVVVGTVAATAGLAGWYVCNSGSTTETGERPTMTGSSSIGSALGAPSSPSRTPTSAPSAHVRRLAPEERRRLAEQIAAARSARAARSTTPSGNPTTAGSSKPALDLEHVQVHLQDALNEAIPLLVECYTLGSGSSGPRTAAASMTLVGDPAIGTLIDAGPIKDHDGHPLAPELDTCLRTTLESLAMPPLDDGDTLSVTYSFKFD